MTSSPLGFDDSSAHDSFAPMARGARARCPRHGLFVDETGGCSRCARAEVATTSRTFLRGLGALTILLVVAAGIAKAVPYLDELREARAEKAKSAARTLSDRAGNKLVVFTTSSCPACRTAKAWLGQNGIAYEERSLERDDVQREFRTLGTRNVVPTFVVGDEVMTGFNGPVLDEKLRRHAMR
jgi:glutaredoxin